MITLVAVICQSILCQDVVVPTPLMVAGKVDAPIAMPFSWGMCMADGIRIAADWIPTQEQYKGWRLAEIKCVPGRYEPSKRAEAVVLVRDDGRYAQSPNKPWFNALRNHDGQLCCDVADGQRIEDADWRSTADGHYQVRLNDQWITVPDYAVLNPRNRPVDYAIVWIYQGRIMCFMVGSGI